jgi:4-hydroxybenzoate polyprenyltransferase
VNFFLNTSIFKSIFFGNFFYGLCAVALAIESSLQQKIPLNTFSFYLLLLTATLLYYNLAFSKIDENSREENPRVNWHQKHYRILRIMQVLYLLFFIYLAFEPLRLLILKLPYLSRIEFVLLLLFPFASVLYYGINTSYFKTGNLRKIGWLKPFIIGFTWAGVVGLLPQLFYQLSQNTPYQLNTVAILLFLKNFMFISVLSIMFDIKDYARDYNFELKTFVVKFGLRKTIFFILIPLLLLGWLTFVVYGFLHGFSWMRIFLNTLPFLFCIAVALELKKRKSIYFYLIIIDGLMLVKALCGSIAVLYF